MKIELRYCQECKRQTIQIPHNMSVSHWSDNGPKYYCPFCGKHWRKQKHQTDIEVKET